MSFPCHCWRSAVSASKSACRLGGRLFSLAEHDFAHYDFVHGSSIHEHFHPQEESRGSDRGEFEVTIDGVVQIARAGRGGYRTGWGRFGQSPYRPGRSSSIIRLGPSSECLGNLTPTVRWPGRVGPSPKRCDRNLKVEESGGRALGMALWRRIDGIQSLSITLVA